MSHAGSFGSTGSAPPAIDQVYRYVSATIDFTTLGVVQLFSTASIGYFVPINTTFLCDVATAIVGDSTSNIGWTPPDYDDYMSLGIGAATSGEATDQSNATNPYIPASTPVSINVTQAETGTALLGRIAMVGYYIT